MYAAARQAAVERHTWKDNAQRVIDEYASLCRWNAARGCSNGETEMKPTDEKQRAREIYNSYKQMRRDPGLLEQTDYRTFEMRVFPIGPRAEQRVQITYYQELDFDHDWRPTSIRWRARRARM